MSDSKYFNPPVGFPVQAKNASGVWFEAVTRSRLEGTHARNPRTGSLQKMQDFPVIWIETADETSESNVLPWPAQFVEPRICNCRHDKSMHVDGRCTDVHDVGVPWDKPCDCTTFVPMENPTDLPST
jgi:hypothetical protein